MLESRPSLPVRFKASPPSTSQTLGRAAPEFARPASCLMDGRGDVSSRQLGRAGKVSDVQLHTARYQCVSHEVISTFLARRVVRQLMAVASLGAPPVRPCATTDDVRTQEAVQVLAVESLSAGPALRSQSNSTPGRHHGPALWSALPTWRVGHSAQHSEVQGITCTCGFLELRLCAGMKADMR